MNAVLCPVLCCVGSAAHSAEEGRLRLYRLTDPSPPLPLPLSLPLPLPLLSTSHHVTSYADVLPGAATSKTSISSSSSSSATIPAGNACCSHPKYPLCVFEYLPALTVFDGALVGLVRDAAMDDALPQGGADAATLTEADILAAENWLGSENVIGSVDVSAAAPSAANVTSTLKVCAVFVSCQRVPRSVHDFVCAVVLGHAMTLLLALLYYIISSSSPACKCKYKYKYKYMCMCMCMCAGYLPHTGRRREPPAAQSRQADTGVGLVKASRAAEARVGRRAWNGYRGRGSRRNNKNEYEEWKRKCAEKLE